MKIKFLVLFIIILMVACENGKKTISTNEKNEYATPTKKSITDPFRWLQLNRKTGTRYNPVESDVQKVHLEDLPKGVMAIVNDTTFTRQQVIRYLLDRKVDLNIPPPQRDEVIENACSNLIYQNLVSRAVKTKQLQVDLDEYNKEEAEFKKMLARRKSSLKKYLQKTKTTETNLRNSLMVFVYLKSLVTEKMKEIEYEKIKKELTQERRFMILTQGGRRANPKDLPDYKSSIEKLRKRAVDGEDFAKLCRTYSHNSLGNRNDKILSIKQGDDKIPSKIYDAVFDIRNKGEFSPAVEFPPEEGTGYFVIKLVDIIIPSKENVDDRLVSRLRERLEILFYRKLIETNMVTRRPKPEVPEEFRSTPKNH